MSTPDDSDYDRRFNGINRLYGDRAFAAFAGARVAVVGIGGVGSWAVEALARSGVGTLMLVDMDVLVASNVNRQLPALTEAFGRGKIDAMAERVRGINPRVVLELVDDFLTPENVTTLLADKPDVVLDCTDDVKAKLALILHCRFNKIPLIVAGAAGGKIDPLKIRVDDLSRTQQDPLLAKIRRRLRKEYGICKDEKEKFGVTCVYSTENPRQPEGVCVTGGGLHCDGYGSTTVVTASVALTAVAEALKKLAR
jgi:tRNA A37 threonylcarbamoyladenosine dehydratase